MPANHDLATKDLRIGMYVAELDRPWSETPFLVEGFRIEDSDQIEVLATYCRRVMIDPLKSHAESLAQLGDLRAGRDADGLTDEAFDHWIEQHVPDWSSRFRRNGLLGRSMQRATVVAQRFWASISPAPVRRGTVWQYRFGKAVDQEIGRARLSYQAAELALSMIAREIDDGQALTLTHVARASEALVASMLGNPDALMWLSRTREQTVLAHSHGVKVSVYAIALGCEIGLDPPSLHRLAMAALLLDIGKAGIDPKILTASGDLSAEQMAEMRRHVSYGVELLGKAGLDAPVQAAILQHHERLDGGGYPAALKGEAISPLGRICGIVDCFAALTSPRPYAHPMSAMDAHRVLHGAAGQSFDGGLVDAFLTAVGIFPVGSLVELSTGEVAAVAGRNGSFAVHPRVLVLTDPLKRAQAPVEMDLLDEPVDEAGSPIRIVRSLPSGAYGVESRKFFLG